MMFTVFRVTRYDVNTKFFLYTNDYVYTIITIARASYLEKWYYVPLQSHEYVLQRDVLQ